MSLPMRSLVSSFLLSLMAMPFLGVSPAAAHCDGLDGPVVTAARRALDARDVKPVLMWVQKRDEAEVSAAFDRTLAVRRLGAAAKELADLYFFETLVRLHRAGEGAPYTGLKPAGRDLGPAIPAADHAIETADLSPVSNLLQKEMAAGLAERFRRLLDAKGFTSGDVEAGRRYVAEYVEFVHYVERLHQSIVGPVKGHEVEVATAHSDQDR